MKKSIGAWYSIVILITIGLAGFALIEWLAGGGPLEVAKAISLTLLTGVLIYLLVRRLSP